MKWLASSLVFFLFINFSAYSQLPECGSDLILEKELITNPDFERTIAIMNSKLVRNTKKRAVADNDVYSIPTVVHIIHTGENIGEGTNISNEQIQSAITALNEDFRKIEGSNGDGDGVDVGIEFCLAARDPDGNSTNGINRVDGSSVDLYSTEGITVGMEFGADEVEVKELSVWPREDYMNIWIVNEIENNDGGSGIQGFAYFPTPNVYDGVVLLHNAFGTVGNLKPYTDLNKTTTHEVGHYLGLYHTFHNSNDCEESNCETQGDRVCDTPVTELNSNCSSPDCGGQQQVENYMDYTDQSCKNMFTEGQKVRMRYMLTEWRTTILSSLGCSPASDNDAGITDIRSPRGSLCSSGILPDITITNYGGEALTSVTVNYQIDNGALQSYDWTGNLEPGFSEAVGLPLIMAGEGSQTFNVFTSNPNGTQDEISENDGDSSSFLISDGSTLNLELVLDYFGSQNTWEITEGNTVMADGGPYADNSNGDPIMQEICLPEGCYVFTMYDSNGDGQGFLSGSFTLFDVDGEPILGDENNWGSESAHDFCLTSATGDAPESTFTSSSNSICGDSQVSFNDTSSGSPTNWFWEFEGGSPSTSSTQNPVVTYQNPGNYTVKLTTLNAFGSDETTEFNYIEVQDSPDVFLTYSDISCHELDDGSANVDATSSTSILWSTGDSGSSVEDLEPGAYSVTATSSAGCYSTISFEIEEPSELELTIFKSDITCYGASDGTASPTVSGGTQPYEFDWSKNSSSSNLENLDQGVYTLEITDANGCSVSENITIIEPSEISVTTEVLTAETCLGSDGSAVANAMGGTGNLTYFWSNEETGQTLNQVPFGDYEITVTDDTGCSQVEDLYIPFECEEMLPTTQLVSANCNKGSYILSDEIKCNQIPEAEMYLWEFSDHSGIQTSEAYTLGNNNTFLLSDVSFLTYGMSMNVKLKVQLDGEWGEWGNACSVDMETTPGVISIVESDCTLETITPGTTLQAEMNTGADEYEWLLVHGDATESYFTYISQFTIPETLTIPQGSEVSMKLRARYGEVWSDFGSSCSYSFDAENAITEILFEEAGINVYPNPNNGEEFSMEFNNLLEGESVLEIAVYSTGGSLIKSFRTQKRNTAYISETYSFENKLSRGVYLIRVSDSGRNYNGKLIVK